MQEHEVLYYPTASGLQISGTSHGYLRTSRDILQLTKKVGFVFRGEAFSWNIHGKAWNPWTN
jgi:hypothetical protein